MLLFITVLFVFYNFLSHVEYRYLIPVVPFVMIFSVRGIENILNRPMYLNRKMVKCLVYIIMVTLPLITYGFYIDQLHEKAISDYEEAAIYVDENSPEPVSVMSPFSRQQARQWTM